MPSSDRPSSRRGFLKALGRAGVSSAVVLPIIARAASEGAAPRGAPPPPAPPPGKTAAPPGGAPAAPPSDTTPSDDARALAEIVKRRYGAHLSPEDLEAVTRDLDSRVSGGARLRATHLANSDEPDTTFRAGPEHA